MMQAIAMNQLQNIALQAQHLQCVCDILHRVIQASHTSASEQQSLQAWVFGSRATGHARPYSDLDILISSPKQLDWQTRVDLTDAFEASALPFRVDVVEEAHLAPGIAPRVMAERIRLI